MKKFSFRLESVLKYRKFRERKAIIKLMESRKAYDRIEKEILGLKDEQLEVGEKCRHESFQGMDVRLYKTYTSYLDKLGTEIQKAKAELEEKETAINQQLAVLKSETIKKKALEVHKESLFEAHSVMAQKEEQKMLDEMIINRQEVKR